MARRYDRPPCGEVGCTAHYGCRLRAKGLQVDAGLHAPRRTRPEPFKEPAVGQWEKGVLTSERPNGTSVPVLHANGTPWRMKEAADNRRLLDQRLRETHAANHQGA